MHPPSHSTKPVNQKGRTTTSEAKRDQRNEERLRRQNTKRRVPHRYDLAQYRREAAEQGRQRRTEED